MNTTTDQNDPVPSIEVRPEKIHTRAAFAQGLVALREVAGLSVRELARKSGIPHSTLGGYFTGRHFPPLRILEQMDDLLQACGVTDPGQREEWKRAFHRARRTPSPRSDDASAPNRSSAAFEPDDAR
jgi:transcriptional regulator with XRE-family HTH domain